MERNKLQFLAFFQPVRRIIVIGILLAFSSQSFSQDLKTKNYRHFDRKWFHFGFMLGMNSAQFQTNPTIDTSRTRGLVSTNTKGKPGFDLGIVTSIKLGTPSLHLRFIPSLSFQERVISYHFIDANGKDELLDRHVESTNLDFPLLLKYRTFRYNNFAAYFIGGMQYSIDLQSKEKAAQSFNDPFIKMKKHDFQAQAGAGVDFFLPFFKFGLEIKYSQSIQNQLIQDNTRVSSPFDKIFNRTIWFSLTFEG